MNIVKKLSYDINTSPWQWYVAQPHDVEDIVNMCWTLFQHEMVTVITPDKPYYRYKVAETVLRQQHYLATAQLLVARDNEGKLLAYSWVERGGSLSYTQEELAEGRFVHVDTSLPLKTKMALTLQALQHWIAWAKACEIPVLVSSTIRTEQGAFMRLHELLGFTVRGSLGYIKL